MVLKSMALFFAKPVHEKAVLQVNRYHRNCHRDRNSERSNARQESNDQTEAAKKLRRDS